MQHRSIVRSMWAGALMIALLAACALPGGSGRDPRVPGTVDLSVSFDDLVGLMAQDDLALAGVPIDATPDYVIVRVYAQADFDAHRTALASAPATPEPARVRFSAENVQSALGGQTMFVVPAGGNLRLSVQQATPAAPNDLVIVANVVDAASAPTPTPAGEFPATVSNLAFGSVNVSPATPSNVLVPIRALASADPADSELAPRLPVSFVYPGASYDWLLRIRTESIGGVKYPIPFQDAQSVAFSVTSGAATLTESNVGVRAAVESSAATNLTLQATADVLVRSGANGDFARVETLTIGADPVPYGEEGLSFDTAPPTIGSLTFDATTRELTGVATDAATGLASLRVYEGPLLIASTIVGEQSGGVAAVTFGAGGAFGTDELTLLAANGDQYELTVVAVDLAGNQGSASTTVGPIGAPPGADAVYYVARSGGDDAADGTFATPWATIGKAVGALGTSGQTIFLKSGTYPENVTITSGTYVIDGQTKASRVIDGDVTITGASTDVTLRNLTINGALTVGAPGTPVAAFVMENVVVTGAVTVVSLASAGEDGSAFFCASDGELSGTVTNLTLCTESNLVLDDFEVEQEITFVDETGTPTTTPPANVVFTNVTAPNATSSLDSVRDPASLWVGSVVDATAQQGSRNNPYATIAAGIAAVTTGGTVNVKAGSYPEQVFITKSLRLHGPNASTAGNGDRRPEAVVSGNGCTQSNCSAFRVDAASNLTITIAGFDVAYNGTTGFRGILLGNTSRVTGHVTIANNVIRGWTTGISLAGGGSVGWVDNVTITGNKLVNTGIGSTENAINLTITDNVFDNAGVGFGGGAALKVPMTGNSFTGATGTRRYVSIASNVGLAGQTLADIVDDNTFDKGVAVDVVSGQWYVQGIFAELGSAIAVAGSGSTLQMLPGTYTEPKATLKSDMTLRGPFADVSAFDASRGGTTRTFVAGEALITNGVNLPSPAVNVTIEGIATSVGIGGAPMTNVTLRHNRLINTEADFDGAQAPTLRGYVMSGTNQAVLIEGNYFRGWLTGFFVQGTNNTDLTFRDNRFEGNDTAISGDGSGSDFTYDGNAFVRSSRGISFGTGGVVTPIRIVDNTFDDVTRGIGFRDGRQLGAVVSGNAFLRMSGGGGGEFGGNEGAVKFIAAPGKYDAGPYTIDLSNNWWGQSDGPGLAQIVDDSGASITVVSAPPCASEIDCTTP